MHTGFCYTSLGCVLEVLQKKPLKISKSTLDFFVAVVKLQVGEGYLFYYYF